MTASLLFPAFFFLLEKEEAGGPLVTCYEKADVNLMICLLVTSEWSSGMKISFPGLSREDERRESPPVIRFFMADSHSFFRELTLTRKSRATTGSPSTTLSRLQSLQGRVQSVVDTQGSRGPCDSQITCQVLPAVTNDFLFHDPPPRWSSSFSRRKREDQARRGETLSTRD